MTVADSYHTSSKKSTFMQSVFNSINILLGVGILALPLGFKVCYKKWTDLQITNLMIH